MLNLKSKLIAIVLKTFGITTFTGCEKEKAVNLESNKVEIAYSKMAGIMKYFTFAIFILFSSNVYSQEQQFTSVIPKKYSVAGKFSLLNSANDTIISFTRNGRINSIKKNENNYILKKRKILFDSNNDTIAFYKGKMIFFPSQNIVVKEKKNRHGWEYYMDNNKILEINYKYNKNEENYHITVSCKKLYELTANLMQLSLGRFDKRVVMEYDDDDDISPALIIALVVASS